MRRCKMAKLIPCFVCSKLVEAVEDKAIAKLCPEHDTAQNREEMRNTPVHQLLRRLNDATQKQVEQMASEVGTTNSKYEEIRQELVILQGKLDNISTTPPPPAPVEEPKGKIQTNEFGEIF